MAISLSAGVRNNLQSLQSTSNLIAISQNRLATGKKVNSAIDDPSAFFTAQNMSDRSAKLTKLLDGVNSGVSTIKAASNGLDSIYKQLQSAQGIIDSLKADVAKASNQASGAATALTATTALNGGVPDLDVANNDVIRFTATGGGTTIVNLGATAATDTVQDLINKVNAQGNGVYSAALTNGKITFTSTGSTQFTASVTDGAGVANATATTAIGGTSVVGSVDQSKINSYAKQFNDVLTSVDQFAADSSFNGVNLLKAGNDLNIVYNEEGTSKSTITSRDVTSSNFSLVNVNAVGSGTVANFTGQEASLKAALASVRTYQSEYSAQLSTAQNRSDFAKNLSNLLLSGAESLTNADQNAEAAQVLALQTRQQLSQSALSLAVQGDQAVLQLLR